MAVRQRIKQLIKKEIANNKNLSNGDTWQQATHYA